VCVVKNPDLLLHVSTAVRDVTFKTHWKRQGVYTVIWSIHLFEYRGVIACIMYANTHCEDTTIKI